MKEWLYKAREIRSGDAPKPDYEKTRAFAVEDGILCRSARNVKDDWIPNVQDVKAGDIIHLYFKRSSGTPHDLIGTFRVRTPAIAARLNDECDLALVNNELAQRLRDAYGMKPAELVTGWLIEPVSSVREPSRYDPEVEAFFGGRATLTQCHVIAYQATRIRRLYVRGYRSIRELNLADLPSIVVLHGENGAGKSNVLRAMALPLQWLGRGLTIAATREESARLDYASADSQLGIRRDDFNTSGENEIQFRMEIELGSRAQWSVGNLPTPAVLEIDIIVQDVGDGIRWWVPRAQVGEEFSLTGSDAHHGTGLRQRLVVFGAELAQAQTNLQRVRVQLQSQTINGAELAQLSAEAAGYEEQASRARRSIEQHERGFGGKMLILERVRSKLLRRELLRVSEAYRRISREPMGGSSEFEVDLEALSGPAQIQRRLYLLATSSDARQRAIPQLLASYVANAMDDAGESRGAFELNAVRNNEFREYETQLTRGSIAGIPITNLGTGEQQLLILLLDVLVSSTPVVQIEEPEAHLHKKLMLRLAQLLERLVADGTLDQLVIATHHHAFALAPHYYDVTCDEEHGTRAILTDRARAIHHFYEPSPLWEALRSLVSAGLRDNAVLFLDENSQPVHARDVLASIEDEGPLAQKFAEEMTKTILLSMREDAEFGES
jgi:hypothetical protein